MNNNISKGSGSPQAKGYSEAGASMVRRALRGFAPNSGSPNEDINQNNYTLRQRSRMLYMAAPVATAAINTNRTKVVGTGLTLKSTVEREVLGITPEYAKEWQRKTEAEFRLWSGKKQNCDALGLNNFEGLQQLCLKSWLLSGDVFVLIKRSTPTQLNPYSLRLHVIEADRVSTPSEFRGGYAGSSLNEGTVPEGKPGAGNKIYDGVEVDSDGKVDSLKINRKITTVQLHHTYSPSYAQFNGHNHIALQKGMRDYHVNTKGWADIAQQFTIFPDGKICTGRNINTVPAGIYGANSTGICIECLGNFDKGGDVMTEAQKNAIVAVTKILLDKFGLLPERNVTYHAWWTSGGESLGDYVKGRSAKTCPGTNFFGGNTKDAYEKNLMPLIENYGKEEKVMLETGNDIVWELMNGKYKVEITEVERAIKAIDKAKKNAEFSSLYWILYKLVNNR